MRHSNKTASSAGSDTDLEGRPCPETYAHFRDGIGTLLSGVGSFVFTRIKPPVARSHERISGTTHVDESDGMINE